VGSPPYVSPEQLIRPREADARSDIWSLGVVFYQCLSGRLPFQGDTLTRLWDSILREPMPAFGATEPPVSSELERVVGRCLEKDPALR
jgi:serine/threonine-protein kinase